MLIERGYYSYPWLGIVGRDLDRETAVAMDLTPDQRGADQTVEIDGAQLSIGGDVIVAIDGQPVAEIDDVIVYLVKETQPGDTITLTLLRNGQERQIDVTLAERPRDS